MNPGSDAGGASARSSTPGITAGVRPDHSHDSFPSVSGASLRHRYIAIPTGISTIFTRSFLQSNPGIVQGDIRGNGAMIGTLAQVGLGPFQFFGLSAGVLTTDSGFGGEKVLQGLIGYETLRRFNLTFDYQSNKVYLALNKYGNDTTFKKGN